MKKKILIALGVLFTLVIIAVIALSLVVKHYLKSDQLKAKIIPRVEEFTGRQVSVDRIDVSLFKGIVVKKLDIREDGREFVSMEEFILDYDLWPLLRKELVISKVALIAPRIHIKRLKDGTFNFSDMMGKPEEAEAAPSEDEGGLPISLTTDRVILKDAHLEFIDEMKKIPDISAETDADFRVSLKDKISAEGYLDIKKLEAALGGINTSTAGRVDIKKDLIEADITAIVDQKPIELKATVEDYGGSPKIEFALKAEELDINKLMALTGGAKAEGAEPAPSQSAGKPKAEPMKITASGTADIKTAKYGEYTLTDVSLDAGSSFVITDTENSVTGNVDLRKLNATIEGLSISANGKVDLAHETVKLALNAVADVPETFKQSGYTLEQAHLDASPNLTYHLTKEDLSGTIAIKELRAAAVKGEDLLISALSLSGDTGIRYNVPSGAMSLNADLRSLSANYDGIDISTAGNVSYDGDAATAKLKGASVKAAQYKAGETVISGLDLQADTDLTIPLKTKEPRGSVDIKSLRANVDGIDLTASGSVTTTGKVATAKFSQLTARSNNYTYDTYKVTGLSLSAVTDMKIDIEEKLPAGGYVELKELKANVNGVDAGAVGRVDANAKTLKTNLTVNVDKDSVKLTSTATNYRTAPNVDFKVTSKRLDINRLMSITESKSEEKTEQAPKENPSSEKKEKPKKLTATGRVIIDRADYQEYRIEGLDVTLKYVNDVLTVNPAKMTMKGGESMVIDGAFLGNVSFKYPRGVDNASEVMKRTMTGKGVSSFSKIQIKDVKVADAIARLTSLEELSNPTFNDSKFNYDIRDQKVNLDGYMNSERIKVVPTGYVGLDKAIDMDIDLNLDPVLARRLIITQFSAEKDGTSTVPLIVKGTTDDPKVTVNAKKVLKKGVDTGIKKLFDKVIPQQQEQTQPTETPTQEQEQAPPPAEETKPEDQIKGLIKGLFGK